MKVAIIGAGVGGLASARRAAQYNLECTVFDVNGNIGGTWLYTDNAFTDEFNNPVHSSLFESVRLLTPAQLMEFDGLEFKPKCGSSFPGHKEVLEYFEEFAKKYNLHEYIKFYHLVQKISRNDNENNWKVTVKDLKKNSTTDYIFDAIMICNGRYSKGVLPQIHGMETFNGDQIHSHNYRKKNPYTGKRLLLVGAGTTALEIGLECCKVAKKVYISYRSSPPTTDLGENVEIRPLVSSIKGEEIHFVDGTNISVDSIIYCTGYQYDCSILDSSCGIEVIEGRILKPLYKMFINAKYPTMCIIGLPQRSIIPAMVDLQAEVFVKQLTGITKLPSSEEMIQWFLEDYNKKLKEVGAAEYYNLGHGIQQYFEDLCQMGNLKPLPVVLYRLREYSRKYRKKHYLTFRNQLVRIIDDKDFVCNDPK